MKKKIPNASAPRVRRSDRTPLQTGVESEGREEGSTNLTTPSSSSFQVNIAVFSGYLAISVAAYWPNIFRSGFVKLVRPSWALARRLDAGRRLLPNEPFVSFHGPRRGI